VLVKALLTGLAMQRRLEPGTVTDDLAVRGLSALVGLVDKVDEVDGRLAPAGAGGARMAEPTPPAVALSSTDRSWNTTQGATP
jgi:hypothetical protein